MKIELQQLGRRFGRDWIFRKINLELAAGSHSIIVGNNGSGKSTLLQLLSGFLSPSEGASIWSSANGPIVREQLYLHVSIAAPYLDVFEDLSLREMVAFQDRFRPWAQQLSQQEVIDKMELSQHADKTIRHFSSGMRQRVKLGLAIMTNSDLLCLDEPTSNLDSNAVQWYRNLLSEFAGQRTLIISTNDVKEEYLRADNTIHIGDYKF